MNIPHLKKSTVLVKPHSFATHQACCYTSKLVCYFPGGFPPPAEAQSMMYGNAYLIPLRNALYKVRLCVLFMIFPWSGQSSAAKSVPCVGWPAAYTSIRFRVEWWLDRNFERGGWRRRGRG